MTVLSDTQADASGAISQTWSMADAQVVPENESVALAGGAKKLPAAMFYADLADSTKIAMYDARVAAKLFKAFLAATARIVRSEGGEIRSFDGDRLMAVFMGQYKNTNAVRAGLKLKFVFDQVIVPKFKAAYTVFNNGTYPLGYSCGIDSGDIMVVRAGIRNNNDLVWVGRAPNIAAKLSTLREGGYRTFITDTVFSAMADDVKYAGNPKQAMWEEREWKAVPVNRIYRSHWNWNVS